MKKINSKKFYPTPLPHDPIKEIFPDIWMVQGSIRIKKLMSCHRNMLILRSKEELTLIHPVRLKPEAEDQLKGLGKIRHVMRLGPAHGLDDAYYVDTFNAEFWCQKGSKLYPLPKIDHYLDQETILPIEGMQLFTFEKTKFSESAILYDQHGGTLLTCDSLQYWTNRNYCNFITRLALQFLKFGSGTIIGPLWLKAMTKPGQNNSLLTDFQRLLQLPFKHFIGAHGDFCKNEAHQKISAAVQKTFPTNHHSHEPIQ